MKTIFATCGDCYGTGDCSLCDGTGDDKHKNMYPQLPNIKPKGGSICIVCEGRDKCTKCGGRGEISVVVDED